MISEKLLSLCIVGAIVGAGIWYVMTDHSVAHIAIAIDPSLSVQAKCGNLRTAAEEFDRKPGMGEGSSLTMLVMGTDAGASEPQRLFTRSIPAPSDLVYGGNETEYLRARQAMFDEVEQSCMTLEPSRYSPIYRMVKRSIAHLRSMGCKPEGRCYLLVKSDLDEDVDPALRDVIRASLIDPAVELPPELAASIDNAGFVEVRFCGTSEIQPRRENAQPTSRPEDRIRIWQKLFAQPELVTFSPFCGD